MKKSLSQTLVKRRLQEASVGTSMTAERVPGGGAAHDGGGEHHSEEGGDGPKTETIEVECSEADCEAVCGALKALKDAGATIHCVKVSGEEYDLETGEPKAPEGSPEHEGAETPEHERAEHEGGGEHETPGEREREEHP